MNNIQKLTIELIGYELFGLPVTKDAFKDEAVIGEVYSFADEQDVTYIVASALSKLGVLEGENKASFFNEQLASIYRSEQFNHDLEHISVLFNKNNIDYIPLKGAVIRNYYPKTEMRTSCDIDILIREEELERALELLYENGYSFVSKCNHDVMLTTQSGSYLELHFTLNEYEFKPDELLKEAWSYAKKSENCRWDFTNEFFIFYHIAHIARHIYTGGCGIRPFIDLKIILNSFEYDSIVLNELLEKADLCEFYKVACDLTKMWFENIEGTEVCIELESYVLNSGIYGNLENKIAVVNQKNGNRAKYILDIIFLSKKGMKKKYPILIKIPVLLPVMHVVRWMSSLVRGTHVQIFKNFSASKNVTKDKQQSVEKLFSNLGLK